MAIENPTADGTQQKTSGDPTSAKTESGQVGSGSSQEKPLTQEAFNQIYRQLKEAQEEVARLREEQERERESWRMYLEELQKNALSSADISASTSARREDDLPEGVRRMIEEHPELSGSVQFIKDVVKALRENDQKELQKLKSEFEQIQMTLQEENRRSFLAERIEEIGEVIAKEMNVPSGELGDNIKYLAGLKAYDSLPKDWYDLPLDSEYKWKKWGQAFREALSKYMQTLESYAEQVHKSKLEQLKANKGSLTLGISESAPQPSSPKDELLKLYKDKKLDWESFLNKVIEINS